MIKIVSDSTCDLSQELTKKYEISIIPLCITLGEDTYLDGIDITPEEIYKWSDEHKTTPKTSAVPFDKIESTLQPMVEAGDDIIFIGISEEMSISRQVIITKVTFITDIRRGICIV